MPPNFYVETTTDIGHKTFYPCVQGSDMYDNTYHC